jgi:hypothetical protein
MWAGSQPPARELMEGGIATTYYVVAALNRLLKRAGGSWRKSDLNEITVFFDRRTRSDGVGVLTMDTRGIAKIATHLRHTCYGYLIMAELAGVQGAPTKLNQLAEVSATALARAISRDELLGEWIIESWPVGGIASYIASRDHLYASKYAHVWVPRERRCWPGVRERMLDSLAQLSSTQLSRVGATKEKGKNEFDEHTPFWHPIKDAVVLRLHSTLGCLSLVGKDLAAREVGRKRIEEIVKELHRQLFSDPEHAPRFSPTSPPSLSAACAMLKMVLGPWYEIADEDGEFIIMILDFIRSHWREPAVYSDYWTEFTAPILQLDDLIAGLDVTELVRQGEHFLDLLKMSADDIKVSLPDEDEREMCEVLLRITSTALGLPHP